MQKVVGSSPIIRFTKPRKSGAFLRLGLIGYHRLYARKLTFSLTSGTRYRLRMAKEAEASSGHAIARIADSGEDAMRNLVAKALPLRMFAGALGIFEELFRTAAEAVSDGDPRVVDLERRMDSLEEQVQTSRRSSAKPKT